MVFKIIHVILLASVKYFLTLPYAMIIGLDYLPAIITVLLGGIGGFLLFYYLSKPVIRLLDNKWPCFCKIVPVFVKRRYQHFCERRKMVRNRIFTRKNRLLARFRATYGFWGIIVSTPVFLTVPIGAFLASKYYSHRKNLVLYMILSFVGWGAVLTGIVHLFPKVFF